MLKDGFGKDRPAQVGACSFSEMRDALLSAQIAGMRDFVVVSHNFEMLKPGSVAPDWIVVKRFERLCDFLAAHPEHFKVRGFNEDLRVSAVSQSATSAPLATWISTSQRHIEQLRRRLHLA